MKRRKPDFWWAPHLNKQVQRNAEAYNCVKKILEGGCPKKTLAVREAAKELGCCERSIWTSLRQHEQHLRDEEQRLIDDEKLNRRWEIEHGLVEPTAEEAEEMYQEGFDRAVDLYIGWKRGK